MGVFDPASAGGGPATDELQEVALKADVSAHQTVGDLPQQLRRGAGLIAEACRDNRLGDGHVHVAIGGGQVMGIRMIQLSEEEPKEDEAAEGEDVASE